MNFQHTEDRRMLADSLNRFLADHNGIEFECYRFDSLDYLYGMARRIRIRRAA